MEKKNKSEVEYDKILNKLFKHYPEFEKSYSRQFTDQVLLEQYKLAFDSILKIRNMVSRVFSYNLAIHFFIISGLAYFFENCYPAFWVCGVCFFGALISLRWSKFDRDQKSWRECQELICKKIEKKLPCCLISIQEKLLDVHCKKTWDEKLFDKILIFRLSLPIGLFCIYSFVFIVSFIYLIYLGITWLL